MDPAKIALIGGFAIVAALSVFLFLMAT